MTAHDDDAVPPPGRPIVLEPTPPGLWTVVVGAVIAVLSPLFGFLIGTAIGARDTEMMSPIFWGLFFGVIVGGCGATAAIVGGWRLYRASGASASD